MMFAGIPNGSPPTQNMSPAKKAPIEVPEDNRKGNRRAFPRWRADFEVRYGVGKEMLTGKSFELGEGGLSFTAEKMYPLETKIDIEYRLGGSESDSAWVAVKS